MAGGKRQIFSILLPGDIAILPSVQEVSQVRTVALTRCEVTAAAPVDSQSGRRQLQSGLFAQSERLFDHIIRLGSLSANQRTIHLLLELHTRLTLLKLVRGDRFRVPLTQDVFAEILGLSVVHVNRTLSLLRRQGLITVRSGSITLHDLPQLKHLGCYDVAAAA